MNDTLNQTVSAVNETIGAVNETVIPMIFGQSVPLTSSPALDILILAVLAAFFTTLMNKYFTDQVAIKALRKEMKSLQKKMRETMKKDPQKAQKIQGEIMKKNLENMKHAMNPKLMLVTMIPMLFLFFFIQSNYSHFGEFLNLGFTTFGWLGTYIWASIFCSIIMKKVLDVA